jgi:TM2 domain-containing membrane protein YozV
MKNRWIALVICLFTGIFGGHHYYLGNWKKGLLYTFTSGGFIICWIYDIFKILFDKNYIENYIKNYNRNLEENKKFKEQLKAVNESNKNMRAEQQRLISEATNRRREQGIACCPKCGCTSIGMTNKKLSLGRVVTGGFLFGGVGAVVGGVTSKKLFNVCQGCGYRWQPGKR